MYKLILFLLFSGLNFSISNAQGIGIGTGSPHASAQLDVSSNNKGFLPPRMTSSERKAISNPSEGLVVFDTDRKGLFLYDSTGWKLLQGIDPSSVNSFAGQQYTIPEGLATPGYSDFAGSSVAIYDNYAFIGAPGYYNTEGFVMVYKRNNDEWDYVQKISAPSPVSNSKFGQSLRAKGNYLFIGAPGDENSSAVISGAVYVYTLSGATWLYQTKLLPASPINNGKSGTYIDANTNGDVLVTYATGNSQVNIYKRSGSSWSALQNITISYVADLSVQPDGDAIAFGVHTPSETVNSVSYSYPGHIAFYIKSGSTYNFSSNFLNPAPQNGDRFGQKVMFGQNYGSSRYILLAGSLNQFHIGSILISSPVTYYFSGSYSATFDGPSGFGSFNFGIASPYVNNFYFSGAGAEYYFVGDKEKITVYSDGSSPAWFAEKGASITLPEQVTYINFGTKYCIDTWASSSSIYPGSQPVYIVVGTPYANDGKGGFYFLKF